MRGKWHILLFLGAVGCAGFAGVCRQHASSLASEADLAQQRSATSSTSFVDTFSGRYVDSQLGQLDQRRQLIKSASNWQEGMLFSLVGLVFLAFAGYAVRAIETAFEDGGHHDPLPAPQRP
jgi:hypothetical protein